MGMKCATAAIRANSEPFELFQGGSDAQHQRFDRTALSLPLAELNFKEQSDFFVDDGVFDRPWIAASSSTIASDELGPFFNARACQGCHIKDGRGHPPKPGNSNMVSMVFGRSDVTGAPDPAFGHQFRAITGMANQSKVRVQYGTQHFTHADGTVVELRRPVYNAEAPLAEGVSLHPSSAPPIIRFGPIEAIAVAVLTANADPVDLNGDGILGRLDMIGRLGWKLGTPMILAQSATAFSNDMVLSTRLRPASRGDRTKIRTHCRNAFRGDNNGKPEVAEDQLDLVAF